MVKARITDGGGDNARYTQGFGHDLILMQTFRMCYQRGKKHNQNVVGHDGYGSQISNGLVGKTCSKETKVCLGDDSELSRKKL